MHVSFREFLARVSQRLTRWPLNNREPGRSYTTSGDATQPNWANTPSLSLQDAAKLGELWAQDQARHANETERLRQWQRDTEQWAIDRKAAVDAAYTNVIDGRHSTPSLHTKANAAAQEAGRKFEEDNPRPVLDGEAGVHLLSTDERNRGVLARLKEAFV